MKRIAVFASGNGSNAELLTSYFNNREDARVVAIYCNKPGAYVINRAASLNIPLVLFNREMFYETEVVLNDLLERGIDLIVLAGFLWLMPGNIIHRFDKRIINIHPALLPLYGGKGMYGMKVHETVIQNKETESGITIHLIDEEYDKGSILLQVKCPIQTDDTPESLAQKIHKLEYAYYPRVVSEYIEKL